LSDTTEPAARWDHIQERLGASGCTMLLISAEDLNCLRQEAYDQGVQDAENMLAARVDRLSVGYSLLERALVDPDRVLGTSQTADAEVVGRVNLVRRISGITVEDLV